MARNPDHWEIRLPPDRWCDLERVFYCGGEAPQLEGPGGLEQAVLVHRGLKLTFQRYGAERGVGEPHWFAITFCQDTADRAGELGFGVTPRTRQAVEISPLAVRRLVWFAFHGHCYFDCFGSNTHHGWKLWRGQSELRPAIESKAALARGIGVKRETLNRWMDPSGSGPPPDGSVKLRDFFGLGTIRLACYPPLFLVQVEGFPLAGDARSELAEGD